MIPSIALIIGFNQAFYRTPVTIRVNDVITQIHVKAILTRQRIRVVELPMTNFGNVALTVDAPSNDVAAILAKAAPPVEFSLAIPGSGASRIQIGVRGGHPTRRTRELAGCRYSRPLRVKECQWSRLARSVIGFDPIWGQT